MDTRILLSLTVSTAGILQMNCDVVVDQEGVLAHVRAVRLSSEYEFDGGVISLSTPANAREVFETAPCGMDSCTSRTDVWTDEKLVLGREQKER